MPLLSLYQTLTTPLGPRTEAWVRRILGAGQAILAILAGARVVTLTSFLHRAHATAPRPGAFAYGPDPHGFGAMVLMGFLVPATVLLGFGSVSVWRNWAVRPVLPLSTLCVLEVIVAFLI